MTTTSEAPDRPDLEVVTVELPAAEAAHRVVALVASLTSRRVSINGLTPNTVKCRGSCLAPSGRGRTWRTTGDEAAWV